jgi:hypothetical protein
MASGRRTQRLKLAALANRKMTFAFCVAGSRVDSAFHRPMAAAAVEKATEMKDQSALSIIDPEGQIWTPGQFGELLGRWPERPDEAIRRLVEIGLNSPTR